MPPVLGRRRFTDATSSIPKDLPTAMAFLDESGSISHDRFFAVGCLKLSEPSVLLREVEKVRDKFHWYGEIHWTDLTAGSLDFYREVAKTIAASDAQFSCFVADRENADPVARFSSPWLAYEKLASQLLLGSIRPEEIVTVVADKYSAPDHVVFEQDVRADVNRRLKRLAVVSVCRLDSKAADPLQLVDLLTGAITFEFRQDAGLAGGNTPKAQLANEIRQLYGVTSGLGGCIVDGKLNVALYRH